MKIRKGVEAIKLSYLATPLSASIVVTRRLSVTDGPCRMFISVRVLFQSGLSLGSGDGLVQGVTLSADDAVSIVTTDNGDMIQIMSSDTDVADTVDQDNPAS